MERQSSCVCVCVNISEQAGQAVRGSNCLSEAVKSLIDDVLGDGDV